MSIVLNDVATTRDSSNAMIFVPSPTGKQMKVKHSAVVGFGTLRPSFFASLPPYICEKSSICHSIRLAGGTLEMAAYHERDGQANKE